MKRVLIRAIPVLPFIVLGVAVLVAAYHIHRHW
jgi:uncharacterized membrane protein